VIEKYFKAVGVGPLCCYAVYGCPGAIKIVIIKGLNVAFKYVNILRVANLLNKNSLQKRFLS
jgi:hypothetical protein